MASYLLDMNRYEMGWSTTQMVTGVIRLGYPVT